MRFFQIISTDSIYNINQLLMNAHEQFPNNLKERFSGNYFNALFVYKKKGIVHFIFGTNYQNQYCPFETNLKNSTDSKMVYEETEHIKYLEEFKYSKSIFKSKNDVNIFKEGMGKLLVDSIIDLPNDLLISIKFRRSNKHKEQNIQLNANEKVLREKKHKTTSQKTYMGKISERIEQLDYLYDVDFQLVTKTDIGDTKDDEIVNNKNKMLKYYNVLKTFMNNNVNNIKIDRGFSLYNIDKFYSKNCYTKEELEELVYVPCAEDFEGIEKSKLPILYQDKAYYIPADDEFNNPNDINMGKIDHPLIKDRYIYAPIDILSEHMMTAGQTGSGKTAEVIASLKSNIPVKNQKNNGWFYIDPKRTGAIKLLNHILEMERAGLDVDWQRVHYINLNSEKYFPQLNLLHLVPYRNNNKIIDRTLELFKDVYDSGDTPLMDKMLRNIFGTLVLGKRDKKFKLKSKYLSLEDGKTLGLSDKNIVEITHKKYKYHGDYLSLEKGELLNLSKENIIEVEEKLYKYGDEYISLEKGEELELSKEDIEIVKTKKYKYTEEYMSFEDGLKLGLSNEDLIVDQEKVYKYNDDYMSIEDGMKIDLSDDDIVEVGATILDAIKLINDKKFRTKVANNIPDGINREFKEFWNGEIPARDYNSTTNRLSLFQPENMKRLYGTYRLDLDFVKWAKEGDIVIVDALDMSDPATTLLIGQCTSTALEQILAENLVPGYRVVVDEGKRAQVKALPRITAEGRQPGVWLYYITQDINLLNKNFAKELTGNITTWKIGRHSYESAKIMSNLVQNDISAEEISNLPNNTMIVKIKNKDGELKKMKTTNDLPYWFLPDGRKAEKDNQVEEEMAMRWTLEKAEELQKRDWKTKEEIDEILLDDYKEIMSKEEMFEKVDESVGVVKL